MARTATELNALGVANPHLVFNGVMWQPAEGQAQLADTVWRKSQDTLRALPAQLTNIPTDQLCLKSMNRVGVDALKRRIEPEGTPLADASIAPIVGVDLPKFTAMVDEVAAQEHGLNRMMGNGGVGTTTLATVMAVQLAQKGLDRHLSTSDPAAHIEETLGGALPNLPVGRIDPGGRNREIPREVIASTGAGLDAAGLALLGEDLKLPCAEEIAVDRDFSRTVREACNRIVLMDTAPTGHSLLLLDATGAYHNVTERNLGAGAKFVTSTEGLQDPDLTRVGLFTLAETTPVREAVGLQEDLRRAGIEPNSLLKTQTRAPLSIRRARHEFAALEKVKTGLANCVSIVPLQDGDPTGVEHLARLGAALVGALRVTCNLRPSARQPRLLQEFRLICPEWQRYSSVFLRPNTAVVRVRLQLKFFRDDQLAAQDWRVEPSGQLGYAVLGDGVSLPSRRLTRLQCVLLPVPFIQERSNTDRAGSSISL